jgi:hypothetical protein
MSRKNLLASGLLMIAVISRVIPHIPNFTPVESIALFSGVYIASRKLSFLLPVIGIYLADLILNNTIYRSFYPEDSVFIWISGYMLWTFIAMGGIIVLGQILKTRLKPLNIIGYSLMGSLLFFIVSNFGVWLGSVVYPKTIAGLIECYTMALPFFRNSLLSNVIFTVVLFGSMEWISRTWLSKAEA